MFLLRNMKDISIFRMKNTPYLLQVKVQKPSTVYRMSIQGHCPTFPPQPQLEYADLVWDPHTQVDVNKIEMVQRMAARWVLGDYSSYSSVTDMLEKLGWHALEQ